MTDKPRHPAPGKAAAKSVAASGAKGSGKTRPEGGQDEAFDFLSPPKNLDELGRLAHYRVLKVLGRGGMGTVFMAEDTRLHRIVALKVMLPSIARKAVARDRFKREAQATAKIEHDHIVTIYEVNEANEVPYLAMQFLKGMTLDDWLKAGKALNIPQILRIGREIAKGLAAAHALQLMHRDIKPSNIWLDAANKGRVKILDFGLARPTNEETHLTQEGMILGTPAFMSPEQARGQNVDARSDLFSLGCVLYRLCAGRLPFAGKDAMSMLLAITSAEPTPLKDANTELPPKLGELIHQLLAKKPEDRPASAKVVVQAIQDIEREWIAGGRTASMKPLKDRNDSKPDDATDAALEESAITDLELAEQTPATPRSAKPSGSRAWLIGCIGMVFACVVLVLCCAGLLVATNYADLTIAAKDAETGNRMENVKLTLLDEEENTLSLGIGVHRVSPGKYRIQTDDLPYGFQVNVRDLHLQRTKSETVVVRYEKPVPPALALLTEEDVQKTQQAWSRYLRLPISVTNAANMKMVLIPPGEFMMGTSDAGRPGIIDPGKKFGGGKGVWPGFAEYQKATKAEMPSHLVKITRPFYMGATEVTYAQFEQFVQERKYVTEPEQGKGGTSVENPREHKPEFTWRNPGYEPKPNDPVVNITWKDAEAFCAWLRVKDDRTYRLPTEAEWEYACRAGSEKYWSFGNDFSQGNKYVWCHLFDRISSPKSPMPVAMKPANKFGLINMHGNVAEMCNDFFSTNYYMVTRDHEDPKGPTVNPGLGRVVRGGSFLDMFLMTRSAYRSGSDPASGVANVGFRVVFEAFPPE